MANVTIYDVAKKCGVSPGTVSKAINNYSAIPSKTKERILKAMKEMNYIPNVGAKALSKTCIQKYWGSRLFWNGHLSF